MKIPSTIKQPFSIKMREIVYKIIGYRKYMA